MTTQFYSAFARSVGVSETEKTPLNKIIQKIQMNNGHSMVWRHTMIGGYSYLSVVAGLVMAALYAWKMTVVMAMIKASAAETINGNSPIWMR